MSNSSILTGSLRQKHTLQPASFWVKQGAASKRKKELSGPGCIASQSVRIRSKISFILNPFLQILPFAVLSLPTVASSLCHGPSSLSHPVNGINLSVLLSSLPSIRPIDFWQRCAALRGGGGGGAKTARRMWISGAQENGTGERGGDDPGQGLPNLSLYTNC